MKQNSLIAAACLYGAVKCFKFFMLNGVKCSRCANQALAGGSNEIIRILSQNKISFDNRIIAIRYELVL